MKGAIGILHITIAILTVLTVIFASLSGIWTGIEHTLGISPQIFGSGNNKITIFIHNNSLYILGLGNKTVISKNNTILHLNNGKYIFEVGFTTSSNNTVSTTYNKYKLNINKTTGMINVKSSNVINVLNIGDGQMSISKVS